MSLIFATQLTAVATLALAVLALVAGVFAGLAFWRQSQEVGLLLEQNRRDTDQRLRAQATRILLGSAPGTSGSPIPYARNASDLPAYYAAIYYDESESGKVTGPDGLGNILPGETKSASGTFSAAAELGHAFLAFRDAQGVYWIRTPSGEVWEAQHYSAERRRPHTRHQQADPPAHPGIPEKSAKTKPRTWRTRLRRSARAVLPKRRARE